MTDCDQIFTIIIIILKPKQAKWICFTGTELCVFGERVYDSSVNPERENISAQVRS